VLNDFYDQYGVIDRMEFPKDVLLLIPDKDFDISPYLERLGLDRFEVCCTWEKEGISISQEVEAIDPKFVFQAGVSLSRKYPSLDNPEHDRFVVPSEIHRKCADSFVGIHHHDEFSIRDGLGQVGDMIKLLKAQRRSFCCITNHGSIGGWIKQYVACKEEHVKAIFGMEAYVSDYRGDDPELKKAHRHANHLVLVARTEEGFYNLIRLHNDAQIDGYYYSPRCNFEAFKKWGKGIIASSACLAGEVSEMLMADNWEEAERIARFYESCFDQFYLEMPMIEFEMQLEANRRMLELSRRTGIPMILTCDSHYLYPEHSETHDLLMLMRSKKTVRDIEEKGEEVWQFNVKNLYYRNADQVRKLWSEGFVVGQGEDQKRLSYDFIPEDVLEESLANTRKIAVSCEDITLDSAIKLPKLHSDSYEKLEEMAKEGMRKRGLEGEEYEERVNFELQVIRDLGWSDYFLIVEDFVRYAVTEFGEFVTGWGRGSAAGSLVSYCLRITDIDPIKVVFCLRGFWIIHVRILLI